MNFHTCGHVVATCTIVFSRTLKFETLETRLVLFAKSEQVAKRLHALVYFVQIV